MSLVVAIKYKNRIVLGSDKQTSTSFSKDHSSTKIWKVPDLDGAIMGGVGCARASQIIQYSTIIDKNLMKAEPSIDFVICSLAPAIIEVLRQNGVVCSAPEGGSCEMIPNSFIFAYKDKAWMIWNDLSVTEIEDYLAIGSGSEVAKGVLFATKDKDPFYRIITAIDAAAESTLFVDNGVDILSTGCLPGDKKNLAKALGIDLKKLQDEEAVLEQEISETSETDKSSKKKAKKSSKSKSKKIKDSNNK